MHPNRYTATFTREKILPITIWQIVTTRSDFGLKMHKMRLARVSLDRSRLRGRGAPRQERTGKGRQEGTKGRGKREERLPLITNFLYLPLVKSTFADDGSGLYHENTFFSKFRHITYLFIG